MPTRSQQDLANMFDAFQNLGNVLAKRKKEKLQDELLRKLDPEYTGGGIDEFDIREKLRERKLERMLALGKYGLEQERLGLARSQEERQADQFNKQYGLEERMTEFKTRPVAPYQPRVVKVPGGPDVMMTGPNRSQVLKPSKADEPSWKVVDQELEAATGHKLGAWNAAENKRIDPQTGEFSADVTDEDGNKKRVSVPGTVYRSFMDKIHGLEKGGGTASVAESAQPPSGNYPVGSRGRKGNRWYVMTANGWQPE